MIVSADVAAATYSDAMNTNSSDELAALSDMAEALGYRLAPLSAGELEAAPKAHPEKISEMITRLAWLKAASAGAKAAVVAYDAEYAQLCGTLADQMAEENVRRATAGDATAYFATTYKLRKTSDDVTTEDILDALRAADQTEMIKSGYSYQTLQAWLKELTLNELPIPEPLARVVELEQGREVRLRPAGGNS
jgi:hypothetical protein